MSGDVELNPGPNSVEGSTDSVSRSSISSIDTLTNHLSILHLNIQSIASKLDLIEGEADYFTTQSTVIDDNRPLPQIPPVDHILHSISISIQDVKDVLKNLDENKSCGPDLISPRLLKQGSCALAIPLSTVFNRSLDQGYFPQAWKQGNLTPIHKKDDKSIPSNYRPISLLSSVGK